MRGEAEAGAGRGRREGWRFRGRAAAAALWVAATAAVMTGSASADPPELADWLLNLDAHRGYNSILADVQLVRYSTGYVYVSSTGIPAYTIGPWAMNPNVPANQNWVFKIPRVPAVNTGPKTATRLGPTAVWINGVVTFNALDAMSYNNQNIWHQNAVVVEAPSFDPCLGHPAPGGVYHHHQNPRCLYSASATQHSPVIGYAYDGYPIYGSYAYANPDGTGGFARMRSSYRLRSITTRTTLPDGTPLPANQYGPPVSSTYPLGYYVEDFEYVTGLGDLDAYNGRTAVTPEFPCGTYAYFATVDAALASAYPYAIGPYYNGVVAMENLTSMGHVTITEPVTTYAGRSPRALLRDASIRSIGPVSPPLASLLPLVVGAPPAGDTYVDRIHDGDADPERLVLTNLGEPLVLYGLDTQAATLKVVKGTGCALGTVRFAF